MWKTLISVSLLALLSLGSSSDPDSQRASVEFRCVCVEPDSVAGLSEMERVRLAVDEADAVFLGRVTIGRVVHLTDTGLPAPLNVLVEYEFEVLQTWKGGVSDTVQVRTGANSCGVELSPYQVAVVYGSYTSDRAHLSTGSCERTTPVRLLDRRDPEIRLLGAL